jgi:hypothetical protein
VVNVTDSADIDMGFSPLKFCACHAFDTPFTFTWWKLPRPELEPGTLRLTGENSGAFAIEE